MLNSSAVLTMNFAFPASVPAATALVAGSNNAMTQSRMIVLI
jgi:hypothetical protein